MSDQEILERLAQLESLVEEQSKTIEQQRERLSQLEAADESPPQVVLDGGDVKVVGDISVDGATGVLGKASGSGTTHGVRGEASNGYGLYTPHDASIGGVAELASLGGQLTGNTTVTSLTGERLSVSGGELTAATTGVGTPEGTILDNADEIRFGSGLAVTDDGNGVVTVSVFDPAFSPSNVAYVEDDTLRTLAPDGTTTDYAPSESQAQYLGTPADLTGDGSLDAPYINDAFELALAKADGTTQTIDTDSTGDNRFGVGDWNEDGVLEIVYPGVKNNSTTLHSVAIGENPTEFDKIDSQEVASVAGVADFDGTGGQDIVWLQGRESPFSLYYSADPSTGGTDTGYTTSRDSEIGTPADFNGDGTVEFPVVNSGGIDLVESDGTVTTLTTNYEITGSPMGALDWTGTGTSHLMHINSDTSELYYYDVVNDTTGAVTDANGNSITPDGFEGVV